MCTFHVTDIHMETGADGLGSNQPLQQVCFMYTL